MNQRTFGKKITLDRLLHQLRRLSESYEKELVRNLHFQLLLNLLFPRYLRKLIDRAHLFNVCFLHYNSTLRQSDQGIGIAGQK